LRAPVSAGVVWAAASPRRRELLEQLGLILDVTPANVDETPHPGERPADYVKRGAAAKSDATAQARTTDLSTLPIVAADTIVIVDNAILGQPADEADARRMLLALAGRRHDVTTAYKISFRGRALERSVTTTVSFRSL